MAAVRVFRFTLYDIATDEVRQSSRLAEMHVIQSLGARSIGQAYFVDTKYVGGEISGMTDKHFDTNLAMPA